MNNVPLKWSISCCKINAKSPPVSKCTGLPSLSRPFAVINSPEAFPDDSKLQRHQEADKVYLIEEGERPGEFMPILEDENGTYIMNSKDLRALEHVERLMKIGVDSLKIEGRTKSHYYVSRTAQVYRRAIDTLADGKSFDMELYADLNSLANRGYTDGFYQRHHTHEYQNYLDNLSIQSGMYFRHKHRWLQVLDNRR